MYNIDNQTNETPMSGADSFNYISGGSIMDYICDATISFDNNLMTVVFDVRCHTPLKGVTTLVDFYSTYEVVAGGQAIDDNGDSYITINSAIRAIKAKLLIKYNIQNINTIIA